MAGFDLSYQDYLNGRAAGDQSAFSESGTSNLTNALSEDEWNKLSQDQKWQELYANRAPMQLEPDDPRIGDLAQRTGSSGGVSIIHGPPEEVHLGDAQWWKDPSKVVDLGNNTYAVSGDNLTDFAKAEKHKKGIGDLIGFGIPLAIITAGAAGAAFGGEAGAAGGIASTDAAESGGTLALNTAGTGTAPYVAGDVAAGAAGAAPVSEGTTPISGSSPGNFAPVSEGSTPIPGTAPGSSGIINGAREAVNSIGNWYNGLTPASRFIIGTAISQGGSAIMRGIAQRDAQRYAQRVRDQQQEDYQRRHQIPAFGDNAFKPRGIIDGARGG